MQNHVQYEYEVAFDCPLNEASERLAASHSIVNSMLTCVLLIYCWYVTKA